MELIEILILLTLWIVLMVCSFISGFFFGKKHKKQTEKTILTEFEKRALEKEKRELKNFWTYNGESQK